MSGIILSHRGKRYPIKQVMFYNYSNEIELIFDNKAGKETGLIFCVPHNVLERVAGIARIVEPKLKLTKEQVKKETRKQIKQDEKA